MKLRFKYLRLLAAIGMMTLPTPFLFACSPVDGELDYKIVGVNNDGTDYVVNVKVNKQFLAQIIAQNRDDTSVIDNKIKAAILKRIQAIYPAAYKNGEFSDLAPSIKALDKTKFQVLFPLKKILTNMPQLDAIKAYLGAKYNRANELKKMKEKQINKLFMPNLAELTKNKKRLDFLQTNYLPVLARDRIAKTDYVDFNYTGITPYAAKKATTAILQTKFGLAPDTTIASFLKKHFENKQNGDQIKLSITLPATFPIEEFRKQPATIFFHIANLEKQDPKTKNYQAKAKGATFISANGDRADLYYSLFLTKDLDLQVVQNKFQLTSGTKLGATSYENIFKGLQVGKQISRIIEVPTADSKHQFNYDHTKGYTASELSDAVASKLFTKQAREKNGVIEKNSAKKTLYNAVRAEKYKAIATFDITQIETYNETTKSWVAKPKGATIAMNDRITISNFKVQYVGLPFNRGAALNHQTYNGYSGFINNFDEQMEDMNVDQQKTITPIFPTTYKTKALAGKLVKFMIKLNEVRKRKPFNDALLAANNFKNSQGKKITTTAEFDQEAVEKFKDVIYNDLIRTYFTKVKTKVPFVLIEQFYLQAYQDIMRRTKKRPQPKAVLDEATQRAKARAMLDTFFETNKITGANLEAKRTSFVDQLYEAIK